MSSLKEIKERINTVNSTMKITGAMKMIASAKLHRAQTALDNIRPYEQELNGILSHLLASGIEVESPYTRLHKKGKRAIVVGSSNSGLCGAFNANMQKELIKYISPFVKDELLFFPVGKKIKEFLVKNGYSPEENLDSLSDKPVYEDAASLASRLMELYTTGKVKQIDLLYYHFHNIAVQTLVSEVYLPIPPSAPEKEKSGYTDYILEPSAEKLITSLLPQVLRLKLFAVLLDNNASEHGARTMAMQQATDNATDLLQGLTLQYNKSRQQSITNELLDIAGGSIR